MEQPEPIDWIRTLYSDRPEEEIIEAEENFRDFILFLFHSNISKTVDSDVLTDHKSQDNVEI